jgi:hypothetical protein
MVTDPNPELTEAFKEFTDQIVEKVQKVNAICLHMKDKFPDPELPVPADTKVLGNGVAIREYENAMEELKHFIENRNCGGQHNVHLKRLIKGPADNRHAIRALEVELVHPQVGDDGKSTETKKDPETGEPITDPETGEPIRIPEWMITGVRVRGLISIEPADGNELPNYSSKSSSSSVPPPMP